VRYGLKRNAVAACSLSLLGSLLAAGWTELNSGTAADLYAVHFPEGTHVGYAVGDSGAILKTTDGGDTWVQQAAGVSGALNSVHFKSNDTGYAVGEAGSAIRTTDGGATWTSVTVGVSNTLTYVSFPSNGYTGFIGVDSDTFPAMVLKTTDGGTVWVLVQAGGIHDHSTSCAFATDSTGVVLGHGGLVIVVSPGSSWHGDAQTDADLIAAAFSGSDPNTGYLIGNDSIHGVVRYTATGGEYPWDSVTCEPVPGAVYGIDVATTNVAYACGSDGFIARSRVPIHFQQTMYDGHADLHGVCFPAGADTGFAVGAGGVILRTYDGGNPMSVAEPKDPLTAHVSIRVLDNPSRRGIAFSADAEAEAVVYDALGRVVARQTAARGLNFVPLSKAGVYVLKVKADGFSTTQKLVVER